MPKIICAQCKTIEHVDEAPEARTTVLCSECNKHSRSTAIKASRHGRNSRKKKGASIPRKKHGTRVMLPITCAECGKDDTLDYVPKGADMDSILCSDCAREQFGTDSDWARIENKKRQKKEEEHEFECDDCGRSFYLPFKHNPEKYPDREFHCNMCRFEHDTPSHERLAGREKAAGGVFIRRPSED